MTDCKPAHIPSKQKDWELPEEGSPEPLVIDGPEHSVYRSLIGGLLYAANTTRVDISFTVSRLSRYLAKPYRHHLIGAFHVLRYLAGTCNYHMIFNKSHVDTSKALDLVCYADADWASDKQSRRSQTGNLVLYGDSLITWKSKLQTTVALSTAEAELVSLVSGVNTVLWIRKWLFDVLSQRVKLVPIRCYCDNQAAISIMEKGSLDASSSVTKHVSLKYHHVQNEVADGTVDLQFVSTKEQLADILTKGLGRQLHEPLVQRLLCTQGSTIAQEGTNVTSTE